MILIFVFLPISVFLALALLPERRTALVGLGAAAALIGGAWAATPAGEAGEYPRILLGMAAIGVVMAAIAQAMRLALPDARRRWAYPAVVGGVCAAALGLGRLAIGS
jgi:hypothetical protein